MIEELFDLPLEKLGPTQADFSSFSTIHGPSHVCRVQAYTILLARRMGFVDELKPAFCAAFLHDLSRRHDGFCEEHGRWAVEEKLEHYLPFFTQQLGLAPEWVPHIVTAVTNHCVREDPSIDDPHYRVTALLKDADALDRWRIRDAPASEYLRLPATLDCVEAAKDVFDWTRKLTSFAEIWPVAVQLLATD